MVDISAAAPGHSPERGVSRRSNRFALLLKALLLLVLLVDAAAPLVKQFSDPDFFWHLQTGAWIWEHRALPDKFLFAATPPSSPEVVQRFTMTSYWMMQVLLHLAYTAGGLGGIVALRFLLWALLLLTLFFGKGGDDFVFLGLLSFAVVILGHFPADRPQFISFVFFGFLLVLLGGIRSAGSRAALLTRAAAIPLLMVLWANCHGGYVVGLGIMALWLLAESLKRLHPALGPLPPERYRILLAAGAAGVLASFLNPNTYHVFEVALLPPWMTANVQEYRSTIEIYRLYAEQWVILYWALLGLTVAGLLLSWRRPDLTDIALIAVTGYFSFTRLRHIPFFLVAAVLVSCRLYSAPRFVGKARVAFATAALAVGILFLGDAAKMYRNISRCAEVNDYLFPVQAADFIKNEDLRGNMFNLYAWGGYLLWRLAPTEVFIDGRNSDRNLSGAYQLIMEGGPFWKQHFLTRGIHYTVTPFFDGISGRFYGLIDALLADPSWVPVSMSPTAIVFAENVPENREVIRRWALPKEQFYRTLLKYSSNLIASSPSSAVFPVAQGEILLRLGDGAHALQSFENALRIAPQHPVARERVASLRQSLPAERQP